jgi:hypothetical protein
MATFDHRWPSRTDDMIPSMTFDGESPAFHTGLVA